MAIAKKLLLFPAALFMVLVGSAELTAQGGEEDEEDEGGLTCMWCKEGVGWFGETTHGFLLGGDLCGWVGSGEGNQCARCGGTSTCHHVYWTGECHIACGPEGDAMAALTEIQQALAGDDATVVASVLLRERSGVHIEFIPEGGRIDLMLPCDLTQTFRTIPVVPALREALEDHLQAHAGRATPEP